MLSEQQCNLIEAGLTREVEPRKVAAYLCLHMGLMLSEVAALRKQDIDLKTGTITICNVIIKTERTDNKTPFEFVPLDNPRKLPIPAHVNRYLNKHWGLYKSDESFILTGGITVPGFHNMQNILTYICTKYKIAKNLSAMDLRYAFIRRSIQSGIDLYSLCAYIGIKQPNVIVNRFNEYFSANFDSFNLLEKYSEDYKQLERERSFPVLST